MLFTTPPRKPVRDADLTALIDADFLAYQCGFCVQHKTDGQGYIEVDENLYVEPPENAVSLLRNQLNNLKDLFRTDDLQLFLTGTGNFREEIATVKPYKGNRKSAKPYHYAILRAAMESEHGATVIHGHEADDEVCIQQQIAMLDGRSSVIIGPDKDLQNMFGWLYNPQKKVLKHITPYDAARHFYYQLMIGDTVDNIQGLPPYKCGPKKAEAIMVEHSRLVDLEAHIRHLYTKHYEQGDATMMEMGRLLHMKRSHTDEWRFDYDWEANYLPQQEVILA